MEATFVRPSVATQQSRGEIVMKRLRILFLLTAVLLFGTHSVFAMEFAVGTCEPALQSFSTISDAVTSSRVPAGSIVEVCPGTYPEQVIISKALTLQGITSGNSNQVIITVPAAGLVLDAEGFAVQVEVTAGPVNITNITVDGKGNNAGDTTILVGIFYNSGSSGVIRDVTTRNQLNFGLGFGILAIDRTSAEAVTIENCSVHDFDQQGIQVGGFFTVTVKANHVNASNATTMVFGIVIQSPVSATDSVTGNEVTGPGPLVESEGIVVEDASATISDNTVTNWEFGLLDFDGAKYTSNTVRNTGTGVSLQGDDATVKSNTVTQATIGIEFQCNPGTVNSNTINDAAIGIDDVRSGLSSANTYFNVSQIRTTCSSAALSKVMPRRPPMPDRP
jgi:hypothetical protein